MLSAQLRLLCMCVISACSFDLAASDCNCKTGCIRILSHRCRRCKAGWYGPYCQKKNVALNGNASQQGMYEDAEAGLAVDGIIATRLSKPHKCAHTDRMNNSWWSVILENNGVNQIRYMKIYNREESNENLLRRRGMEILIDGKRCKKWAESAVPGTIEDVTCSKTLTGNNLTIRVLGAFYSVCEVQVFVCSDGWFGEACEKQCKCLNSKDLCDKVDGRCKLGCKAGYTGYDCQTPCTEGQYGLDCSSPCGHCVDRLCNRITGECLGPCQRGWDGRKCDVCQDGWYGPSCTSTCGHCVNKTVCNKANGDCSLGCGDGWSGRKCDVCKDGRYGQDCSETCAQCAYNASCDNTTGSFAACCEEGLADDGCERDSSIKWYVLQMVVSAAGTGFVMSLFFAGIISCLLRQGRLQWGRKSIEQPGQVSRDRVQTIEVPRQQEDLYMIPTRCSSTFSATENYDVIETIYENI